MFSRSQLEDFVSILYQSENSCSVFSPIRDKCIKDSKTFGTFFEQDMYKYEHVVHVLNDAFAINYSPMIVLFIVLDCTTE